MNQTIKYYLAKTAFLTFPQFRFDRTVFLLGHMRCGSTALANVLMANNKIKGYGESHVSYNLEYSPALLGVSLIGNGINPFRGELIFDKILHNIHDSSPDSNFYNSKAVFMIRHPVSTVISLNYLAKRAKNLNQSYSDLGVCLDYYISRLKHLKCMWIRFPENNRYMLSYESLLKNTEQQLNAISRKILNNLEIRNEYSSVYDKWGTGDPINAPNYNAIKPIKKDLYSESTKEKVLKLESLTIAERLYEDLLEQD